jgi:hypothetical protein
MAPPPHHIVTRFGFAGRPLLPENSKTIPLLMVKLLIVLCWAGVVVLVAAVLHFARFVGFQSNPLLILYLAIYVYAYTISPVFADISILQYSHIITFILCVTEFLSTALCVVYILPHHIFRGEEGGLAHFCVYYVYSICCHYVV